MGLLFLRVCWAVCVTPSICPGTSCRRVVMLFDDNWAAAAAVSPIWRSSISVPFPRGTMTNTVSSVTRARGLESSPMIELLRWVGWKPIFGYQRSSWSRGTILGPRHLVRIAFADKAAALAVVAFVDISIPSKKTVGDKRTFGL
jgi:hypothetical protein